MKEIRGQGGIIRKGRFLKTRIRIAMITIEEPRGGQGQLESQSGSTRDTRLDSRKIQTPKEFINLRQGTESRTSFPLVDRAGSMLTVGGRIG